MTRRPLSPVIEAAYKADRRYALAQALQQQGLDSSPAATPLVGLARIAQAGLGAYKQNKLDTEYQGRNDARQKALSAALADPNKIDWKALSDNPDTSEFALESQLAIALEGAKKGKDQGVPLTADQVYEKIGVRSAGNLKPDGTIELLKTPEMPSYAPNTTIVGPDGNAITLPNKPPEGFQSWNSGPNKDWLNAERDLRTAGPRVSAGAGLVQSGVDAGGPNGQRLVDQGMSLVNGTGQQGMPAPQPQQGFPTQEDFTSRFTPGSLAPPSPVTGPAPTMDRTGLPTQVASNGIDVTGMPSKAIRTENAKTQVENVNNAIKFGTQAQGFGEKAKLYDLAIDSLGTGDVGPASRFVLAGKKLANNMGADFNTTPANMVDAMNKEFTSIMQFDSENGRVFSGSLSNSDREFFQQRAPGLSDDIPSLKLKKEMLDKANTRSAEIGRIALQYRNDPAGFETARQEYIDSHPLFDSSFRQKVDSTMKLGTGASQSGWKIERVN